ncbi:ORFS359W [Human betaherpesvirus 5]|nr:ORFS359W [Human betaherpesvirus 5]QHX40729.1 ORFS359W [Human betaherpesvirus 5]
MRHGRFGRGAALQHGGPGRPAGEHPALRRVYLVFLLCLFPILFRDGLFHHVQHAFLDALQGSWGGGSPSEASNVVLWIFGFLFLVVIVGRVVFLLILFFVRVVDA